MATALAALALAACESTQPAKVDAPAAASSTASPAPAPPPAAPSPPPAAGTQAAPSGPSAAPVPEPVNAPVAAPAPPAHRVLYIKTSFANFRAGPTTAAKALGVLRKGTRLEELDARNQWHRVKLDDGREGWVAESVTTETPP